MAESEFVYVIYIRTTPEQLWSALTQPEFTRRFWADTVQECEWKKGATWKLIVPDGRVADEGEVVEIDPPRKLTVTWRNHLFAEMTPEGYSRMSYEIEQKDEETVKLTVTHTMDRKDSKLVKAVSNGWPHILSSLKSMLETGESFIASRTWPKGI
jgi:uncharacterized protein YndB with AHSA1/START domain